jgi:hypothetical protein
LHAGLSLPSKPAASAGASGTRAKKPIDLGAAASFAALHEPVNRPAPVVADLFGDDNQSAQPTTSSKGNFSFDGEDDGFDPRNSNNANGSFGDFSAAFGSSKVSKVFC